MAESNLYNSTSRKMVPSWALKTDQDRHESACCEEHWVGIKRGTLLATGLRAYAADPDLQQEWMMVKKVNKMRLSEYTEAMSGVKIRDINGVSSQEVDEIINRNMFARQVCVSSCDNIQKSISLSLSGTSEQKIQVMDLLKYILMIVTSNELE
ncbi:hypothetical protein ACE6H2_001213 [Prunus campanulata]